MFDCDMKILLNISICQILLEQSLELETRLLPDTTIVVLRCEDEEKSLQEPRQVLLLSIGQCPGCIVKLALVMRQTVLEDIQQLIHDC